MDYHPQQLLKVSDLQKELCVSRATAYRMTKYLPMVRVGAGLRISRADLQTFLQTHEGEIPTSEVQAILNQEYLGEAQRAGTLRHYPQAKNAPKQR